jgi:hypothetical protein
MLIPGGTPLSCRADHQDGPAAVGAISRPDQGTTMAATASATEKAAKTVVEAMPRSRAIGAASMAGRQYEDAQASVWARPGGTTARPGPIRSWHGLIRSSA